MKVKTFILSLFLTMFCSTSFGQHWGEIPNHYEGNMTFVTQIFIDDVLQGEDIEIGAFCGDEFRGSARPIASQSNMVYLLIEGDGDHNGDQISFKLARHYADNTSVELDYVIFNALTYEHNARIGASPADLVNGLLPEDDRDRTEFNSVASLNGEVYPSLANALAACTTGNNTIELLKDNAEDVTIKQVEGVNVTIDGGTSRYDYSGTITIHGNARYQGTETLTFTNIDFTTNEAGHYFIDSNSTGSVERYAHNVTVINCNFNATGAGENSAAAMRIRQGYNIAINGGKFNGLHSVLQAYGNAGINITGIESNCKNGISVGSSTNVVITGSDITATGATGYGVRAGENVTGPITITGTEINAFIPVSVRKVTDDTNCEFTFTGNTMTASNTDGYWCVIGTSEYEANGSLPETAGKIIVNATEQDLAGVYGYSRVEVTFADSTKKYFYMMEDAVPYNNADNYEGATIKLLSNCAGIGLRFWENDMTFDLNGKNYTITQAVGSSGTESQGFQIRPEVTGNVTIKNGTIDIKAGTNVKWMFNSYAADFVVQNVTIDGTNMVTNTSEDYLLVVQNAGDKATFENVTIQNYDAKKVYLEGNTTFVTPQEFDNSIVIPDGYVLEYENGAYIVKAGNVWNETKDKKYATLAEAITAAAAGDSLVLLADITENVTVNKDLTIKGDNKHYTGNISVETSSTDITVKNVNFVNGTGYAITTNRIKSVTVEDCTVNNYGYGFLYANKSTPTVNVKNVTVEGGNYGFHWVYGTTATLENVTMTNMAYGIMTQNYGAKTITIKNSSISGTNPIYVWERNTTVVDTFKFEGANTFSGLPTSDQAKLVLGNENALTSTLTAPEGFNVESGVNDYAVTYENGVYKLVVPTVKNVNTGKLYDKLQAAIDEASSGDEIEVINNIEVTIDDLAGLQLVGTKYPSYYVVRGKTISIDLNGMMIKANVTATDMLLGLFSTEQSGNLTLKDSSNGNGKVEIVATNDADVYSLITNYDSSSAITIDGGNYILNKVGDSGQSLIYDSPGKMVVNGGNFYLGNLGQGVGNVNENGIPWIFNVKGQNDGHVTVNGGTFNADVNHQHWAYEVNVPNTLALKYNGDEARTWTVVPAVAQGTDSWKGYNRSLGYASIADAAHWATAETTVTVVADHAITETAIVESNITLDFAGEEVTCSANPAIRIQGNVNVTVKNGNMNTEGYNFILGASDGSSAGNLTIESGKFHGTTTVASVTKGNLNITGGEFSVEPYQGNNYAYLINCIDSYYNSGDAEVSISGGTFHNWNPQNNAAEGANTNFCADGYGAITNDNVTWTVIEALTRNLEEGWNWFSSYVEADAEAVQAVPDQWFPVRQLHFHHQKL